MAPNADLYGIENSNRGCSLNVTFNPGKAVNPTRSIDGLSLGPGIITGKMDATDSDPFAVNPGGIPLFKDGHAVGGIGVVSTSPGVAEFAAFSGASESGFLPTAAQFPPPGVVIILVGPAGGTGGLAQSDVSAIIDQAVATAQTTRAVIRLPSGSRTRMTIAVVDLDGTILALHRMPDATVFSIDVAVAKARNVIYFSSPAGTADLPGVPSGTAITNRTIGFAAQSLFPPGIDGSGTGPFFGLLLSDLANPCTQGSQPPNLNQNGIVFFPGSLPLYRNGLLVGGLGVSGDGVDQDDYVTNAGAQNFQAPTTIRADQVLIQSVRLPYLKFPRNPTD